MQDPQGHARAPGPRRVGECRNTHHGVGLVHTGFCGGLRRPLTMLQVVSGQRFAIVHNPGSDFPIKKLATWLAHLPTRARVNQHPPRMRLGWEKGPPDIATRGRKARAASLRACRATPGPGSPGSRTNRSLGLAWRQSKQPSILCSREKVDPCPFGAGMVFHPPAPES